MEGRSRVIGFTLMCWFLGVFLIIEAFKTREDYKVISGLVTEEGHTEVRKNGNNYDHVYYFRLSGHGQLLGVGTDEDLKPISDEGFRGLRVGDMVRVTFDENWATEGERVNQTVMEIVLGGEAVYDVMPRSYLNGRMMFGLGFLAVGTTFLLLLRWKRVR